MGEGLNEIKAHHLLFDNAIDINPRLGTITLNEKRMALLSVEALGLLRKELITTLSMDRAKGFLLRLGWASGFNDGSCIEEMHDWNSKKELILAGPSLHTLEGLVTVEPDVLELSDDKFYLSGNWYHSFEAEEHIRHFGCCDEGVCWILIGYVKGYLEKTLGKSVYIYEQQCMGKGDEKCYFVAQTVEEHVPEYQALLRYFQTELLATELDKMYSEVHSLNQSIKRSEEIHQKLTNLLLDGDRLSSLLEVLSRVLGRSVVIERGKVLASVFYREEDRRVYQETISNETFIISANKVNLGKLIIIGDQPLNQEEQMIIQRSLSVFAIQLYTQRMMVQLTWKKKVDFFEELLEGRLDTKSFLESAQHLFEFDIEKRNRVIVIKSESEEKNESIRLVLNAAYPTIDMFMKECYLVLILPTGLEEKTTIYDTLSHMESLIKKEIKKIQYYIGIGRISNSIVEIGDSYQEAFRICDFLKEAYPKESKRAISDQIDPIMLFLRSMNPKELIVFYEKTLGHLIEYDRQNESSLVLTLKHYLDNNGNINMTAQQLNLSIPGLRYRMEKIESLCQVDLKTGNGRFHCQIAILVYYMMKVI